MNIPFESDEQVDVELELNFTDGHTWQTKFRLSGYGPLLINVVGRWPQDVVSMLLSYDNCRFSYPIEVQGDNLKTVHIYGGRDHWSQLLRNKALGLDHVD